MHRCRRVEAVGVRLEPEAAIDGCNAPVHNLRRRRPRRAETAPLSEVEREAVCFRKAERVLRL